MPLKSPKTTTKAGGAGTLQVHRNLLLLVAFIEGASVMAVELAGAKMIAPFYGTSLYVWASVLAVTLGGLTLGYFLGGWATYRFQPQKLLFTVLLSGTVFIALMPLLALKIMPATEGLGLRMGSLLSATSFMILPLLCMGMVSPTIIQLNNKEMKGTGKTAGTIYAISTVGGITMTLLMGFYFLPEWGIRKSLYLTAGLLGLMPLLYAVFYRRFRIWTGAGLLLVALLFFAASKAFSHPENRAGFKYVSEGILGQVSVFDDYDTETRLAYRFLFINMIPQTFVNVQEMPVSAWKYPHRIAALASIKPARSRALLIGMGGGSISMELKKLGFSVDIVEIDKRMPDVARRFFGFSPDGMNIIIDDGRHYLRTTGAKYDLVVIDVLNGESQPYHMFTEEAFSRLKEIISPDALVLINFQGHLFGEAGRPARSIMKTLEMTGFKVRFDFEGTREKDGDLHLIASPGEIDFAALDPGRLNPCCRSLPPFYLTLKGTADIDLADAMTLTDDKTTFETMNNQWIEDWRLGILEGFMKNLSKSKMPFFE